jgi:hypothetical protein
MATIDDNVDHFLVHPMYAVAALLPDHEHVNRMIEDLSADVDADTVVQ